MAVGLLLGSSTAQACGVGPSGLTVVGPALLMVFLLALIATLSLRAASRSFSRMYQHQPTFGIRVAEVGTAIFCATAAVVAVLTGGLMLAATIL